MSRLSEFLKDLKHRRDSREGRLPEQHLEKPGIRPEQISADTITPEQLATNWDPPIRLPEDVALPPIKTDKLLPPTTPNNS